MERWEGRVALVTGASRGIGKAIALRLTEHGMKVVACSRSFGKLKDIHDGIMSFTGTLYQYKCDLTETSEIIEMFDWIKTNLGGIDVCINNAAMSFNKGLLDATPDEWRYQLELNVVGLSTCTSMSVQQMISRGVDDGQVIHIGSLLCQRVVGGRFRDFRFQAGIKHMIAALTEGLRQELREKKSHIRVALVSPSGVDTSLRDTLLSCNQENGSASMQLINPNEVADIVIHVIEQKPHVQIHEVFFRPTDQVE